MRGKGGIWVCHIWWGVRRRKNFQYIKDKSERRLMDGRRNFFLKWEWKSWLNRFFRRFNTYAIQCFFFLYRKAISDEIAGMIRRFWWEKVIKAEEYIGKMGWYIYAAEKRVKPEMDSYRWGFFWGSGRDWSHHPRSWGRGCRFFGVQFLLGWSKQLGCAIWKGFLLAHNVHISIS